MKIPNDRFAVHPPEGSMSRCRVEGLGLRSFRVKGFRVKGF